MFLRVRARAHAWPAELGGSFARSRRSKEASSNLAWLPPIRATIPTNSTRQMSLPAAKRENHASQDLPRILCVLHIPSTIGATVIIARKEVVTKHHFDISKQKKIKGKG
jgi:hypothetical protein